MRRAGLRIVLMRLGVDSLLVLVPVLLIAGVVIPLVAERILRPTPLRYVFEMPPTWLPGETTAASRRQASAVP